MGRQRLLTALLWVMGIGLQFLAPLLRDRVPLSDDLFIGSFLYPWWFFAQVLLLTALLAILQNATNGWSEGRRAALAITAGVLFMLPQPDLISQLIGNEVPLSENPLRVALLWSSPIAFYVVPAGLVVYAWLKRDVRFSLLRALGLGLVAIGALSFPYILWLTNLWGVYIEPQGGGTVWVPPATWPFG